MRVKIGKRQNWLSLLAFVLAGILYALQQAGVLGGLSQTVESNQPGLYTVKRFVDGDTLVVNMNGHDETVRFIGVDTPETHKPGAPVQCYGPAAAAYTKNTVGDHKLRLASDSLSTDRDRYKRLLRYVYLDDDRLINQALIKNGYGFYYPYFPFTKSDEFAAAQASAQQAAKGLWAACQPKPTDRGGYISNDL